MTSAIPHSAQLLNILHVIPSMAAEIGGPPAVCAGLAAALADRGHRVTVAAVNLPGGTSIPIAPDVSLQVFPLDSPQSRRYIKSTQLDHWLSKNIPSFDIVHLHSLWQFPTFAAARACWHHRKPYVVLLNGMLDHYSIHQRSYLLKRFYWLFRERKIEGRAAAIHCLNRAEIRRAVPWISRMPKIILGNGINADQLRALPPRGQFRASRPDLAARPLVLFLSRLHPKKGLDRLIPAWKNVAAKLPDARLFIAGTGDPAYAASLQKLVADNNLSQQIRFLGQIVGPQKWQALVDADLFVLPSHQEGFSMAITEALAAGCPPVVTQECNFDELQPAPPQPPCGIIIKNHDMNAFTSAILSLLNAPQTRQSFAAAGRRLVADRFTWQTIAAQLEQNYRDILAGKTFSASP